MCVFNEQDAQAAARAEAQSSPSSYGALGVPGPSGAAGAFFASGPPAGAANGIPGAQRRAMQPQGLVGMGGMGGNARPPGKSGLTFDHILSRLQGELQKSRETGAELHGLQNAMSDIHETLGGNVVSCIPAESFYVSLNAGAAHCSRPTYHHFRNHYLPLSLRNLLSLRNQSQPRPHQHRRLGDRIRPPLSTSSKRNCRKRSVRWRPMSKKSARWRACSRSTKL